MVDAVRGISEDRGGIGFEFDVIAQVGAVVAYFKFINSIRAVGIFEGFGSALGAWARWGCLPGSIR